MPDVFVCFLGMAFHHEIVARHRSNGSEANLSFGIRDLGLCAVYIRLPDPGISVFRISDFSGSTKFCFNVLVAGKNSPKP